MCKLTQQQISFLPDISIDLHGSTIQNYNTSLKYLTDEGLEEVGLVSERVMDQPLAEGHDAMGEVVLGQPRYHPLLLHVGTSRHVHDQVAQVLPVPGQREDRLEREDRSCFEMDKLLI